MNQVGYRLDVSGKEDGDVKNFTPGILVSTVGWMIMTVENNRSG